jgi:PAS domain S-box-containing protein
MTTSLSHWREEARHRAEQLQASYERFFAVTQSVHDAIVSTDAGGAVIFWHRRAEALFGFSESEAVGRLFPSLLAPGSQERYAQAVAEISHVADGAPHALTFDAEGIRADGTAFPVELSLASWKSGTATCFTAVIRDVTERRRAEEALRLRDQQLREAQKMDAIGRLASGIAHDFNNSLMVIQGHAEMLLLNLAADDTRARKKVEVIIQSTTGASAITRRLLTFGRKQVSEMRLVDPREHVAGVQKVLGRLLGDNIAVVCDTAADAGHFRIDPDQLDQVIMNLAINARDAMAEGGELRFDVRKTTLSDAAACARLSLTPGDYVTISVRDTGCGMDEETAARIFEPFFTTKEAGRGTGLGLAIVADIINGSDGRIEVDTAPGRGTTFRIHFPRVEEKLDAVRSVPAGQAPPARGSETILIAEDKPLVRRILRTALENAGYTVLDAPDGEQALELARGYDGRIDLLLTDVVMPGRGGFELYEGLSKLRPDVRVIFMSGHPPGAQARERVDQSGELCLQKPFSVDVLLRELRTVLESALALA